MHRLEYTGFMEFLASGDEKAFSDLYNHYWESLFGYVMRVLQDKDESMDVVQDTFITIWEQRATLGNIKTFHAYIHSVARYKALGSIRKNIREQDYLSSLLTFLEVYGESPEEQLIADELKSIIDTEVANLPDKMREVFLLSREQQLSYKEIAAKLNISDKTVKKQISNALKLLRLKTEGGTHTALLLLIILKKL